MPIKYVTLFGFSPDDDVIFRSVRDLIRLALKEINVLAAGESPAPEDEDDAFTILNLMLGTWGNKRHRIFSSVKESFTLVVGQTDYTIGLSGDFDTTRPLHVLQAYIRDASGNDIPVEVLEDRAVFEDIRDKDVSGRPYQLYFERLYNSQQGNILLNRAPQTAETLFLVLWKPFGEFGSKTEDVVMPPGYEEAIYSQLAIRLAPSFGKSVPAELAVKATNAVAAIDSVNLEIPEVPSDAPARALGRGRRYNINSG
jgi:hypothetical protein